MPGDFIRIFSDVHYGERASRVRRLEQLRPLCDAPGAIILNGDTTETRPGPDPAFTAQCVAETKAFFAGIGPPVTFITGNHDPDISTRHSLDLSGGEVWVTHGDIIFDDMVPWARDAPVIRRRIRAALDSFHRAGSAADAAQSVGDPPSPGFGGLRNALHPHGQNQARKALTLEERLVIWRQIAVSIPQRHQSEQNRLKYAVRLGIDLVWPPWRIPHMVAAWQRQVRKTAELVQAYRPQARFALIGHTHRPGSWRTVEGIVVINTGSFCRPLGAHLVDLSPGRLTLRRVRAFRGEFRPGSVIREFALAREGKLPQDRPT